MSAAKRKPAAKPEPEKRGPGRPPVDPTGDTVKLTLRIGPSHQLRLKAIAMILGKDQAGAMRWLIENADGERPLLPPVVLKGAMEHLGLGGRPATPQAWER